MNLNLTLTRKWFELILSGEKKEEYREIKPYWEKRLIQPHESEDGEFEPHFIEYKGFDTITFTNGYGNHRPSFTIECKGIDIGAGKPEWGSNGTGFILHLGDIISKRNIPEDLKNVK